jgi:hypothetical protein
MQDMIVRSCPFPWTPQSVKQFVFRIRTGAMRRPMTGTTTRTGSFVLRAIRGTHGAGALLSVVVLLGAIAPENVRAQAEPSKSASAAEPAAPVPLGRYVPREHLIVYAESAGLDAHAEAWQKTASYKMLNETPLGVMLEAVAGQLLDKAVAVLPNRRLSGPEIVTLLKGTAKSGWVFALHIGPKAPDLRVTFVVRGAASKELKPISSRLMGWLMGTDAKYKIERKEARTMVAVPTAGSNGPAGAASSGWVWWPEKNDLVIGAPFPAAADAIIAALDGKAPSAVDHPLVQELKKPEATFEPVSVAFVDTAGCPDIQTSLTTFLRELSKFGINRIDLRRGFDGGALMSVTRLIAPKPWNSTLALFDQPTFDKASLMPMPDSVGSFVELSISPAKLLDALEHIEAAAPIKAQIDIMAETIKNTGQIDLRKDILSHLGPRMVAYLAPGRSATTNDDSLEAALKNGLTTAATMTALQSYFPKLTLVFEVDDPEAFGKGLDTLMIAINNELESQAREIEVEERRAAESEKTGGADRAGGRSAKGGERPKQRRILAPRFNPIPGQAKSFVLMTPTDSKLRFGPSSFRPTILVEGKYVAFSVSSDAARAAAEAARRKDWKPSSEVEKAFQTVGSNLIMLGLTDVSESLSSLLASLPGTLQTMINTSIALAKVRAAGADGPPGAPGMAPGMMPGMAPGMAPGMGGSSSMRRGPRGPSMGGGPGPGGPGMGGSGSMRPGGSAGPAGTGSAGAANEAMIVIKVDPDKLPKAADLKSHLFPATFAISVADQEIRFVSRGAFPDLSMVIGVIPAAGMLPPLPMFDRTQQAQAGAAPDAAGETAPAPAAPGGPRGGGPGMRPGGRPGRGRPQ